MSQCSATTKIGTQCRYNARVGFTTCGKHVDTGQVVHMTRCTLIKTDGKRCTRSSDTGGACAYHARIQLSRAAVANADAVWGAILDRIWTYGNPPVGSAELYRMINEELIQSPHRQGYLLGMRARVDVELVYYNRENRIKLKGELHRIALDAQSVHTRDVSKQTNEGLEKILEANDNMGESNADVLKGVLDVIRSNGGRGAEKICTDVGHWFATVSCRENGDRLYRKSLRGLWALINESAHFHELCKRFVEECKESVGMCCEGHISRLCNVLVGFDDAFVAPVPVGEILQQKIALIAAKEVAVEHKVGEAWVVFEELKIPMAERMPWLEAF